MANPRTRKIFSAATGLLLATVFSSAAFALSAPAEDQTLSLMQIVEQSEAQEVAPGIYKATGFGNTFLVTTKDGNVIIDTSMARNAPVHKTLLDAVDAREPKYIIVTHGHGDHAGGIAHWKGKDTQVIAQRNSVEFQHYQKRLANFFTRRNAAQFGFEPTVLGLEKGPHKNFGAALYGDIQFDDKYSFSLGELTFEVIATPSETYDALSVWIPERKAVFVGDIYYESFPNIYTLRGTKARWALDYVTSLDRILALNAEILIPSHGEPVYGAEKIERTLTHYRDAILYVHDATVAGMNAGKSVDELVDTIALPEALKLPETYGTVAWSVRGIYEGYAGWFDGNPSTMLGANAERATPHLVSLSDGAVPVLAKAKTLFDGGESRDALAMVDAVLASEASHQDALRLKISILQDFAKKTKNFNASGWIANGIRESRALLVQD